MFRALRHHNYRIWAAGGLISNIGTWMQRTAQDWLVLAILTHHNATAVGITMGLQFGPQVLLLAFTGTAADRFDRRRLLLATQSCMAALALGLGLLTVLGAVRLWEVYGFAFLLGCAAAFDAPARLTFVAEVVGDEDLPNAVGLNSTSFNLGRMVGPAVAGVLIARFGTGWVFLINAASYAIVLGSLAMLRVGELHRSHRAGRASGGFGEGLRYLRGRPDLVAVLTMLFVVGTFGFNFQLYIASMAVTVFRTGAGGYGLLTSSMALGSVAGALLSAARRKARAGVLVGGALAFGVTLGIAAWMPDYVPFALMLVLVGISAQTFLTTANSTVQLATEPAMRGRVMAILVAILLGGTPIGSPLSGWVADTFGPRWALGIGSAAGIASALVGVRYLLLARRSAAGAEFGDRVAGRATAAAGPDGRR